MQKVGCWGFRLAIARTAILRQLSASVLQPHDLQLLDTLRRIERKQWAALDATFVSSYEVLWHLLLQGTNTKR